MQAVSAEEAVAMIPNGASVMVGGFMGVGTPERLRDELVRQRRSGLSIICNDAAVPGKGVGKLFDAALVSSLIGSHIGLNPKVQQQMMANKIAVDLTPQVLGRRAATHCTGSRSCWMAAWRLSADAVWHCPCRWLWPIVG